MNYPEYLKNEIVMKKLLYFVCPLVKQEEKEKVSKSEKRRKKKVKESAFRTLLHCIITHGLE